MFDEKTKELIAIGSSVAANCHPCVKFHINKARGLGIEDLAVQEAIAVGRMVRRGAAGEMDKLLADRDGQHPPSTTKGCFED
jgi:AhpD family alkylhydroperoxidase